MRSIAFLRIFFAVALIVSGMLDLWASNFFSTPVEQLTASAVAGAAAAIVAKLAHAIS